MKRTNFRTTISLLWCVAALLMVLPRPGAGDEAQAPAQFSVGDHVLVSPTGAKNDYRPGVVIEVRANQAYLVETDDGYGGIERCNVLGAWVKSAPVAAKVPDTKAPDADGTGNAGGSGPNGSAPQNGMKFKVGSRVEVDVLLRSPAKATYEKATVVAVDAADKSYIVAVDPLPGRLPMRYRVPVRPEGLHWIRALPGADKAPRIPTEKLRVDAHNTVLADRPLLSDFDRKGKNGVAPSQGLVKKLVRSLWERPSSAGADGATTVDIQSVTVGAPRRWRLYDDLGQGNLNTLVYPLYVKWNQKTFYRTKNVLTTGQEGHFNCFVDNTGRWQCGSTVGSKKAGTVQEIMVVP